MSTHATAVPGKIVIRSAHVIEGEKVLETDCTDYDQYSALPMVVEYHGSLYARTGWSSDTHRACYKTSRYIATAVPSGIHRKAAERKVSGHE